MKCVQTAAQCTVAVWLVCMLAGAAGAVFYTKTRENDYPRIGRRAFFTVNDKGSRYPRIGRSSPGSLSHTSMSGNDVDFRTPSKRSGFRLGGEEDFSSLELSDPSSSAESMTSLEEPEDGVLLPLGLLFFSFDSNGDKMLTRDEFVQGMQNAQGMARMCR